jgi:hypothetical protein|tara:strand:- start:1034 stop:1888 length:855 start_codon:yes stop_codon:yes gene_type:complete
MKIKHSKYRNTGLIYELLVKQIASDTLSKESSPAVDILKKYFSGNSTLVKEFKLYEYILKNSNISQNKAELIISTITEVSRKLNRKVLKKSKYGLISEIRKHYNLDEFFGIQVSNYKAVASLYCLLEAQNNDNLIDPDLLVNFKSSILEHLTTNKQDPDNVKDTLIEEYSKYDKDLKLLTFKFLLEKFNDKYKNLLPEQKNILRQFITSVNSSQKLRTMVNEELNKIKDLVKNLTGKVKDDVVKIKLVEVSKNILPLTNKDKVSDSHLVNLMMYYDLVNELKTL